MHAHFPSIVAETGQDEVQATMEEHGIIEKKENVGKSKKYDLKLVIGRDQPSMF